MSALDSRMKASVCLTCYPNSTREASRSRATCSGTITSGNASSALVGRNRWPGVRSPGSCSSRWSAQVVQ